MKFVPSHGVAGGKEHCTSRKFPSVERSWTTLQKTLFKTPLLERRARIVLGQKRISWRQPAVFGSGVARMKIPSEIVILLGPSWPLVDLSFSASLLLLFFVCSTFWANNFFHVLKSQISFSHQANRWNDLSPEPESTPLHCSRQHLLSHGSCLDGGCTGSRPQHVLVRRPSEG